MKILLGSLSYKNLTGSELYLYELARQYVLRGHEVMIVSDLGITDSELINRTRELGVILVQVGAPLDPNWVPDVLHLQQYEPTRYLVSKFPKIPTIVTVHSQFIYEKPYLHNQIDKYISVKPAVTKKLQEEYRIDPIRIAEIGIPVDGDRFKPLENKDPNKRKMIVSAMTVDFLRRRTIFDLINKAKDEDADLYIIGHKFDTYLDTELPENIHWIPAAWDIEKWIRQADETAGIMFGKMTAESLMCGVPSWVYTVGGNGDIEDIKLCQPEEYKKTWLFEDSKIIADKIIKIFEEIV